jgi:hypothetical protein
MVLVALAFAPAALRGQEPRVDPQSLMTTPVHLFKGAREVSQGTGFFYGNMRADQPGEIDTVFLVTNYHVLTGHAPKVKTAASGDRIRFLLHNDENDLENVRWIELPLYDAHDNPIWVASETYASSDVVLVPLPASTYSRIKLYVFTEAHTLTPIRIRPTSGATLLGYPYGFFDRKHWLPIWKTGHVASEPDVDFEGEPTFLVDVSAFPGMSGSPVLAVANGIYETEEGLMRSGTAHKLLGIFSSMPVIRRNQPDSAGFSTIPALSEVPLQLGYVWKSSVIADIAKRYRPKF